MATIKIPRKSNPDYVKNPLTGRYIKKTSKTYSQLINDKILNLDHGDRERAVLATGTQEELQLMKDKLSTSTLVQKNKKLEIRNGRLQTSRVRPTKSQTVETIKRSAIEVVKDNRSVLTSAQLTNQQIDSILTKLIDAKLLGVNLNVENEVKQLGLLRGEKRERASSASYHRPPRVRTPISGAVVASPTLGATSSLRCSTVTSLRFSVVLRSNTNDRRAKNATPQPLETHSCARGQEYPPSCQPSGCRKDPHICCERCSACRLGSYRTGLRCWRVPSARWACR